MNSIRFLFRGIRIDNRTEEYIKKRLKTLERIIIGESFFEVEVDLDKKGKFRVEVMIKISGKLYRAEEITESVEGSIDIVEAELRGQILKDKEKINTLKMRGRRSIKKKMVLDGNARF